MANGKVQVSKQAQQFYCQMYPEVPCKIVARVLHKVKSQVGKLDAATVDWFMRPERQRHLASLSRMVGGR
jgi:hypothetical protein